MDDNKLASNDPDEFSDEYFEELEKRLLKDDDPDRKFAPDSGRSVFELDRLKRKRAKDSDSQNQEL